MQALFGTYNILLCIAFLAAHCKGPLLSERTSAPSSARGIAPQTQFNENLTLPRSMEFVLVPPQAAVAQIIMMAEILQPPWN